jgi:hypothetical protein
MGPRGPLSAACRDIIEKKKIKGRSATAWLEIKAEREIKEGIKGGMSGDQREERE